MSLGDENRNPGNLKAGEFTRLLGHIGKDRQGHAIFPGYSYGLRALEVLLLRKARGQSIAEIGRWYAEDPRWAEHVAGALWADAGAGALRFGVGVEYRPDLLNSDQLRALVKAIHHAEGTRYGG